jgi:hypothetical protein
MPGNLPFGLRDHQVIIQPVTTGTTCLTRPHRAAQAELGTERRSRPLTRKKAAPRVVVRRVPAVSGLRPGIVLSPG